MAYIETLAEAYFRAGKIVMAEAVSRQLFALDPKLSDQLTVWINKPDKNQ